MRDRPARSCRVRLLLAAIGFGLLCLGGGGSASAQPVSEPPFTVAPQLGHAERVVFAGFLPDGQTVLTASYDRRLKLWNAATGREMRTVAGSPEGFFEADLSPDGRLAATIDSMQTLKLWELGSGRELASRPLQGTRLYRLLFSPDARTLAVAASVLADDKASEVVQLFSVPELGELRTLSGQPEDMVALAFGPDGSSLLSSSNAAVIEWDVASGRQVRSVAGPSTSYRVSGSFSPDRRAVAYLSGTDLKLREVESGRELKAAAVPETWRTLGPFSPDGRLLALASDAGFLLWNAADWTVALTIDLPEEDRPETMSFSPDSRTLLTSGPSGRLKLWDVATGRQVGTLSGGGRAVWALAWSPDGNAIVSGGDERDLGVWDARSGSLSYRLASDGPKVRGIGFSPDGAKLLAGGGDQVSLFDLGKRELLRAFRHGPEVRAVAFAADGRTFVSGSEMNFDDHTAVKLWDVASGRLLRGFRGQISSGHSLAFSRDGKTLFVGGAGLEIWDVASGRLRHRRDWMGGLVYGLAVWPDGAAGVLGSWSGDDELQTWSTATGRAIRRFKSSGVNAVAIVPGGPSFVAGDLDGHLKLWDSRNGRLLTTLEGHEGQVTAVAVSPDGKRIVSGSLDGTVRVWSIGGDLLTTSVVADNREWASVTPEGFFEASREGARLLNVLKGREVVGPADKVHDVLHRPDLVREKLAGDPGGKVREAAAQLDLAQAIGSGPR